MTVHIICQQRDFGGITLKRTLFSDTSVTGFNGIKYHSLILECKSGVEESEHDQHHLQSLSACFGQNSALAFICIIFINYNILELK